LKSTEKLRAATSLIAQATIGVTNIAEGVHRSVRQTLLLEKGAQNSTTTGITGLVYSSIRGTTGLVSKTIDKALLAIEARLSEPESAAPDSESYQAIVAALNGVIGDQLAANANPLATTMSFHFPLQADGDRILLVIHGLCMNDLQWTTMHDEVRVNHAQAVSEACGFTPVYLRYNTGRAIQANGAELNERLEDLLANWPTPIRQIHVLAHSMGGLVIRSAVHQAQAEADKKRWRKKLKRIAFLGTPHHGAPLEKAGHWIDILLGGTRFSKPFLALTKVRSQGIHDLRHGLDDPLPRGVEILAIAACTMTRRSLAADKLSGDGLVSINSALGVHLGLGAGSTEVFFKMNHMQLLGRPEVKARLIQFFS
jgi:pimeloyl-ACP methyl ester carboxylesterase